MAENRTSPWIYAGCGCAGCLGLGVLAVIAISFFGASMVKDYVEDIGDPAVQAERAKELLGTEELPADYHARIVFRIPWVFDAAILTDGPAAEAIAGENLDDFEPLSSENLGVHAFIYLAVRRGATDEEDLDSVFGGRRSGRHRPGGNNIDLGSQFESREELSRGSFELDPGEVSYVGHRGEIETEDGERFDGVYSQMKIDCPGDSKLRFAVWFERAPEDGAGEDAAFDAAGTPADEEALRDFLGHFNLCT